MNSSLLVSLLIVGFFSILFGIFIGFLFTRRYMNKINLEKYSKVAMERQLLEEKLAFVDSRNKAHVETMEDYKKEITNKFENLANKILV